MQKAKQYAQRAVVGLTTLGLSGLALADDSGVAAITALKTEGETYISAAFAVAVVIAGGFWGIKMMKKAFSKAG